MLNQFRSYQLAVNLYRECTTIEGPGYLRDQLLRASLSVVLNLAEGSAKPSYKDRQRFYGIAFASLREVQAILDLVHAAQAFGTADTLGACLYRLTHPKPQTETGPAA